MMRFWKINLSYVELVIIKVKLFLTHEVVYLLPCSSVMFEPSLYSITFLLLFCEWATFYQSPPRTI